MVLPRRNAEVQKKSKKTTLPPFARCAGRKGKRGARNPLIGDPACCTILLFPT
jgi:hypothetical protein